jgi:hypothetical protein
MSVPVEHAFIRQNVIGDDELVDDGLARGSRGGLPENRRDDRDKRDNGGGAELP